MARSLEVEGRRSLWARGENTNLFIESEEIANIIPPSPG
jgi:hypothetical protein